VTARACIVCCRPFVPTANNRSRCPDHVIPKASRDRSYRTQAHRIIAASSRCGISGGLLGVDPTDPSVVDHIIPRAHGRTDDPSNLQAAHKSRNGRKSAHCQATSEARTDSLHALD
jgi:5-methylcytosine-specific restriction endonuclease McrA